MFRSLLVHHQGVHNYIQPHTETFYHPSYVELSQIRQYMIINMCMCTENYKMFKLRKL